MIRTSLHALGRAAALAASLVPLVLGAAAPADPQPPEEHCVVLLGDAADEVVCAATSDEAIAAFTARTGLTISRSADDAGPLVTYSLAELFANASYGGTSALIVRATPCDGVTLLSISDLTTYGLNDQVSSFRTYSGCTVRLYADPGYSGSTYGYTTSQATLPTFNDIASSARVR